MGSWEKKLLESVNNKSKPHKRSIDDDAGPPPKRGRPKLNTTLLRYPPVEETEIDTTSAEALKCELTKERPRKELVLTLMKKTFPSRRTFILQDAKSVTEILLKHPELKLSYAVRLFAHCFFFLV